MRGGVVGLHGTSESLSSSLWDESALLTLRGVKGKDAGPRSLLRSPSRFLVKSCTLPERKPDLWEKVSGAA